MAYSEYVTQLSLDRFAEIVGIHFLHFNQIRTPAITGATRSVGCSAVIYQHRYQSESGTPGRNDIAREIMTAEHEIEQLVHFPLIRRWIADERIPLIHGRPFKLTQGYVVEPGVRVSTLVEADAAVTGEDADGDGYEETAVVTTTLAAAITDVTELRLYYPGKNGEPRWEIRPVQVDFDANTLIATIRCSMSQLVDPKRYEQMIPEPISPAETAAFLATVDVYQVSTDTTISAAYKIYCGSTLSSFDTTGLAAIVEDPEGGILRVLRPFFGWNAPLFCDCPFPTGRLSYIAGHPQSTFTTMASPLEKAVAMLAMARLGGICECTNVPPYNKDLSITTQASATPGGSSEHTRWASTPPARVMKNPFGVLEGERRAYDIIVSEVLGETGNSYLP